MAHAPALLQRPADRRVPPALDAHARAQGLLRDGADPGGISGHPPDVQPGAFDARPDRRICARNGERSIPPGGPEARGSAERRRALVHPAVLLPGEPGAADQPLSPLRRTPRIVAIFRTRPEA